MGLWGKRDDMVVHEQGPYNAEPPRHAMAGRVLTSVESFYARNHGPIPIVDTDGWRLRVDGLVEHPLTLSLQDLKERFESRMLVATLQCAGTDGPG
jgi:sulfite oxidase